MTVGGADLARLAGHPRLRGRAGQQAGVLSGGERRPHRDRDHPGGAEREEGLAFADMGHMPAAGRVARASPGKGLLEDPEVGRLFPGTQSDADPGG